MTLEVVKSFLLSWYQLIEKQFISVYMSSFICIICANLYCLASESHVMTMTTALTLKSHTCKHWYNRYNYEMKLFLITWICISQSLNNSYCTVHTIEEVWIQFKEISILLLGVPVTSLHVQYRAWYNKLCPITKWNERGHHVHHDRLLKILYPRMQF